MMSILSRVFYALVNSEKKKNGWMGDPTVSP
jgi:hypothetical protein